MRLPLIPLLALALLLVVPARGGGPLYVNTASTPAPIVWSTAGEVLYHCETGGLGTLSNAQAMALVAQCAQVWEDVPTGAIGFEPGTQIPHNVSTAAGAAHYTNWLGVGGDGINPVIFDTDGAITGDLLGSENANYVLGFAGVESYSPASSRILEAEILLNGRFIDGQPASSDNPEISVEVFRGAVVHEFGHFIGLDHAQLNPDQAFDGLTTNDDTVPTMFPFNIHGGTSTEGSTLHRDDVAAVSSLYPTSDFSTSTGSIEGEVILPAEVTHGDTGFQGMNVVARRIDAPLVTAASRVSGYLFRGSQAAFGTTNGAYRGFYRIDGLPPGDYTVEIESIDGRFQGGSSVGPLEVPAQFAGVADKWNGYNEGPLPHRDRTDEQVILPVSAGQPVTGVNFFLNYRTGIYEDFNASGPNDLDNSQIIFTPAPSAPGGYTVRRQAIASFPHDTAGDASFVLGDDEYLSIDFSSFGVRVPIYGAPQTALNVSSNGFLTFGTPSIPVETAPVESVDQHLGVRPRIAALWDDLDPSQPGASVFFGLEGTGIYVSFLNVPLKGGGGANSFQYHLASNGTISISYLGIAAAGGLAGISSGGPRDAESQFAFPVDFATLVNDAQPPSIAITAPGGTVSGTVGIESLVTDGGASSGIRHVEYYLDGLFLGSATSPPYSVAWDTTTYANAYRRLEAFATDNSGNIGQAATIVSTSNSGAAVLTHSVTNATYAPPFLTFTLNIRNDSGASVSNVTLNSFWYEGTGAFPGPRRMYANPTSGGPLPRNLGSLNAGQSASIQLKCYVPADVTGASRWVNSGEVTLGGTTFKF
jgi:hypothetical protein